MRRKVHSLVENADDVDAVFRGGDKHSNHGDTVLNMIRHMLIKIKRDYRWYIPIIIRMDSSFFDQKILNPRAARATRKGSDRSGETIDPPMSFQAS
jgi:hypothetical protein